MFDPKSRGPAGSGGAGKFAHRPTRRANQLTRMALAAWLLAQIALGSAALAQIPVPSPQENPAQPAARQSAGVSQARSPGVPRAVPPRVTEAKPPRMIEAERFRAARGWASGHRPVARANGVRHANGVLPRPAATRAQAATNSASGASAPAPAAPTWQALGPAAVVTPDFGLVSGRVAALALDDAGTLYIGTTGGGVWMSNDPAASSPASHRRYAAH